MLRSLPDGAEFPVWTTKALHRPREFGIRPHNELQRLPEGAEVIGRVRFWSRAVSQGAVRLNSAAGWIGLIVLVLGVAAGIAVPLVYRISHWLTAIVLMGIFIVVVLEGTYSVWRATEEERATLAGSEAGRSGKADLRFELRGNGELFLFIRNLGPAEASAITVSGALDNGFFERISGFASSIQPDTEQGLLINPSGYAINYGHSQWELEVSWEDGAGHHDKESFTATRSTSAK
jgi:hypothetical protein